jgi:YebC/PmpR family DNA-binding regulatory protein
MSRHWHNIKDSKGKLDSKRAAKFTQLGRAITMAARKKGGDPAMNAKLWTAIEKAKAAFMPKDNIERAVKKGTGEIEAEQLEELVYEGYGPGGAAVLVECVTDNRNRTAGNVKHAFSSNGGNLGATNSVAWMFERKGVITVPGGSLEGGDPDEAELKLIEAGAEDIKREPEGWAVFTSYADLQAVRERLEASGLKTESAEIEYVPKDALTLSEEQKAALADLVAALEEDEDVKAVYTNADF